MIERIDPGTLSEASWTSVPMNEPLDGFAYIDNELWAGWFDGNSIWIVGTH